MYFLYKRNDYKVSLFIKVFEISFFVVVFGCIVFNRFLYCGVIELVSF